MEKAAPDWDHLRTFLAVLEHGSLSGAAVALRLTQPTAGRHIAALETALATPLFVRSRHGLLPTPAALELRGPAEAMQAAAAALVRTASGEAAEPRGTVRITASEVIGAEVLPPILAALHRQHPAIAIELALTNRAEDLTRRVADIAVRMHRPAQGALVARRIGRVGIGLFAHRDYVAAHGMPRRTEDLSSYSLIGFDRDETGARSLGAAAGAWQREMFRFRSDSDLAQLAALRAGFGIGGCQIGLARHDPRLVRVLARQVEFGLEMWLVMHEDLRLSRRVRLIYDHLAKALSAYVAGAGEAAGRPARTRAPARGNRA
ncbi:MAG: LysR family transcriptional regulator [Alphaproteobacteria bacterium]|nr:LysR family transcriptional regulator [Alphaproteobacteria bacterium]MDE2074703.1 LysR family transcriptional regulator [Alphaproteobacteria bacterium]